MGRMITAAALVTSLLVAATACTAGPPTITPGPATADPSGTETAAVGAETVTVQVLNTEVAVGFERVAFEMLDPDGQAVSSAADVDCVFNRVTQISDEQRMAQKVASGKAVYFGGDMPGGGSWIVYSDFDASGPWWLDVTVHEGDRTGTGRAEIEAVAKSTMPRAGDKAPMADTPKIGPATPLDTLTSDPEPLEALYTQSVADATAAGKPAAVLFASATHCDDVTACAATLAQFKMAQSSMGSQVVFINVESRDLNDPTQLSAAAKAWGLKGEPWTFVVDKRGFVQARAQGEMSATELELLLQNIMAR
jgi:hypothetical protein